MRQSGGGGASVGGELGGGRGSYNSPWTLSSLLSWSHDSTYNLVVWLHWLSQIVRSAGPSYTFQTLLVISFRQLRYFRFGRGALHCHCHAFHDTRTSVLLLLQNGTITVIVAAQHRLSLNSAMVRFASPEVVHNDMATVTVAITVWRCLPTVGGSRRQNALKHRDQSLAQRRQRCDHDAQ